MNLKTDPAERIRRLSAEKRATLLARLPPLSSAQRRLWFLQQLDRESCSYNMTSAVRVLGRLETPALRSALNAVVTRHQVLRTRVVSFDGTPYPLLDSSAEVPLEEIDLRHLPESERRAEAARRAKRLVRTPFDLARSPLLRAGLYRLGDTEHLFPVVFHHVACDDESMGIFWNELRAGYELALGGSNALPPLPCQYADFARWQYRRLQSPRLRRQIDYWRRRLTPLPEPLELAGDHPRPRYFSTSGKVLAANLPADAGWRIELLRQRLGVTPFQFFLTAFKILLHRYTGQTDIAVGVPVSHRQRSEFEKLIGCFVNMLVIRSEIRGSLTFQQCLDRVREEAVAAYGNRDAPFETLVQELQPTRDQSRTPVVQIMFVYRETAQDQDVTIRAGDIVIRSAGVAAEVAKFDLALHVTPSQKSHRLAVVFNTDLFLPETMSRFLKNLQVLLSHVAEDPNAEVSRLRLLDAGEQAVLASRNSTRVENDCNLDLIRRFEEICRTAPEKTAAVARDGRWTYRQLNRQANAVAALLKSHGVGPESIVGVTLQRNRFLLPALLGVLKAGAAYLPLEADLPVQRRRAMLTESRPALVLTERRLLAGLERDGSSDGDSPPSLCLDLQPLPELDEFDTVRPHPDNMIYVIHTSGSTGRPKGVVNTYGALLNRIAWMQRRYRLADDDIVLQKTPLGFDVSFWEWCWPLVSGASVALAEPGRHAETAYLVRAIREWGVTTLHFVPSVLQLFLEEDGVDQCTTLRRVICSGEALAEPLRRKFQTAINCELHNLYGPTEAAIDVTAWDCREDGSGRPPPIGKPIDNIQIHILDGYGNLAPIGVPGGLFISGDGLARGYLNQPALTAERFLPDPHASRPGARMYRTGDIAKTNPDGTLEFLGRGDDQVKVRGVRIELGEVEAALQRHPQIREAVVTITGEGTGAGLAAYFVPRDKPAPAPAELRGFLAGRLPESMLPSRWIALKALPRGPSGKIDRKSLPPPAGESAVQESYRAPRNEREMVLAGMFEDLLKVERVGIDDSFFELGGHSLLANRLVAAIRQRFAASLPLRTVFARPTVAGLAETLAEEADLAPAPPGPEIRSAPKRDITQLLEEIE